MPKATLADRVSDVIGAATTVFGERGYRRAAMADIATAAGLSPGALYRYVESKEALLLLLFTSETARPIQFPVPTPEHRQLLDTIATRLAVVGDTPKLDAALSRDRRPRDVATELNGILGERYDLVAENWQLLAVVERSALDLPELFELYFHAGRRHLTQKLATYLERRMIAEALHRTPDIHITARFIEESLTWFAWHRHQDPDSAEFNDSAARATAIAMNAMALLPTDRR